MGGGEGLGGCGLSTTNTLSAHGLEFSFGGDYIMLWVGYDMTGLFCLRLVG